MTRSFLLLIGGVLAVSAISLFAVRSPEAEHPSSTRNVYSDEVAAVGVFVPNLGQAPSDAFFYLKRDRSVVLLKATSIAMDGQSRASTDEPHGANLYFISANKSPKVVGLEPLGGLTGFKSVRYQGLYPGIDLRMKTDAGRLSATFMLAAGADLSLILFKAEGWDDGFVGAPTAYQVKDGYRIPVSASFEAGRYGSTRLTLGWYDVDIPIEINFGVGF